MKTDRAPDGRYLEEHDGLGDEPETVVEVARKISEGQAFTDADAVRVARAYIALTGVRSVSEAKERPVQSGDVREDGDPGRARMPIGEGLRLGHVSLTNPTHQPPNDALKIAEAAGRDGYLAVTGVRRTT